MMRRGLRGVLLLGALSALTACGGPAASSAPAGAPGKPGGGTQVQANAAAPKLVIQPADKATGVRLDAPIDIRADGGSLTAVNVSDGKSALTGVFDNGRRNWSWAGGLESDTTYTITVTAAGAGGNDTSATASFHTLAAPNKLDMDSYPGDGSTVGVGMPIKLIFNTDVPDNKRQNLVDHIAVDASPAQAGGWIWFSAHEAHYRPAKYWQSGTTVTVRAQLLGVDAGDDYWGESNWSETFTVGDSHISYVDTAAHRMTVYSNGQLQWNWPVSTGRPNLQTINGTLVVWGKSQVVRMDSTGLGIPRNSPDGYFEDVYWDTAISTDGFYVHAAPWSVWAQGYQNVSHGCVNLSPSRAVDFFNFSRPGDVVIVQNSTRAADWTDGEGDWQLDASQLVAGGRAISVGGGAGVGHGPHAQ
jgi:lipoprotein-anchoring transpeptidase ErfK/SrfK